MSEKKEKHLWEPVHSYYCNPENYYAGRSDRSFFKDWASFLEEWENADFDYNLLFRWDWDEKEGTLTLFWMGQRKGLFQSTKIVEVTREDEPSVRAWLEKRWKHLASLWAPLSGVETFHEVNNET